MTYAVLTVFLVIQERPQRHPDMSEWMVRAEVPPGVPGLYLQSEEVPAVHT